ncbi:transposase family protein [Rothia nasimurium]|uniref:transposase family protein n=1 Tax=Rothia nasimurium TaxID=85336 RepID=UPI003AF0B1E4
MHQALKATLLYHRHNLTEELLANIFGVSQPTISRTINLIEKAPTVPGSLVIDGTLIPTWNWRSSGKTYFSGKHKKAGFNYQVICTPDGRLLAIADPPPGVKDDTLIPSMHRGLSGS